jgi:DNA-binding transcriptional regulator YhcF (GntR family)
MTAIPNQSDRVITRKVAARWTESIAQGGWAPIAHDFLDNYRRLPKPLTTIEAMVVVMLIRHKWDDRHPFPSVKRLGRMMGLGSTSIRNHIRSLEAKGYLKRIRRPGSSNAFDMSPLFQEVERTAGRMRMEKMEQVGGHA